MSATSIRMACSAGSSGQEARRKVTEPASVNFIAFEIRLFSTCRSRMGSPLTEAGMLAAPSTRSARPLARASPCQNIRVWAIRLRRLKSMLSTDMWPASSLA